MDQLRSASSASERSKMLVRLHETHFRHQLAALAYLKSRPFVDSHRLAVAAFRRCWLSSADRVTGLP
jgi:hypothetical protein